MEACGEFVIRGKLREVAVSHLLYLTGADIAKFENDNFGYYFATLPGKNFPVEFSIRENIVFALDGNDPWTAWYWRDDFNDEDYILSIRTNDAFHKAFIFVCTHPELYIQIGQVVVFDLDEPKLNKYGGRDPNFVFDSRFYSGGR